MLNVTQNINDTLEELVNGAMVGLHMINADLAKVGIAPVLVNQA